MWYATMGKGKFSIYVELLNNADFKDEDKAIINNILRMNKMNGEWNVSNQG